MLLAQKEINWTLACSKGKKSGRGVRIGTHTTRRGKTKCKRVKDNRVKAGAKVEEGTI